MHSLSPTSCNAVCLTFSYVSMPEEKESTCSELTKVLLPFHVLPADSCQPFLGTELMHPHSGCCSILVLKGTRSSKQPELQF